MPDIRVLLIDDDRSTLNTMMDYLRGVQHFEVDGFEDGPAAMDALRKKPQRYNVLLLDWTLRPESGDVLLRKVRGINPNLPAIVMTGNAEAGAEAYGSGAFTYFQKPVDLVRLVQAIQSAVNENKTLEDKSLELSNINTLLIEQQTLKLFASAIINKATSLVQSSGGCFYLWNWEHRKFQELARMGYGASLEEQSLPDEILNEFQSQKTDILIDSAELGRLGADSDHRMQSQIAVLLRRADLYLGLLVLGKAEGAFSEEDEKTLHALKAMVAPLLEEIKVRERLQEMQQKNYTTEDDLCNDAVKTVFELLGSPTALWQVNAAQTEITVCSAFGLPDNYTTSIRIAFDDPDSLLASAARDSQALQRTLEETQPSEITSALASVRSEMAIPMSTFENAPIGVVTLFSDQANAFKEYDVQLVQNFISQVARSIDTLRRHDQSQKLAELSETLVTQAEDENTTFGIFAETIRGLTGADTVVIYPYDPQRQHYYKSHIHAEQKQVGILTGDQVPEKPRLKGLAYVVRYVGKIVAADTSDGDEALQVENLDKIPGPTKFDKRFLSKIISEEKYIQREHIRSFVGISLRSSSMEDEVGVMYINFRSPRRFTNSEINLLQIAAGQVAGIIQNRRIWIQQRIISDALKEVIAVIGTTEPLKVILDQTAKLFVVDRGSISRITDDGQHMQFKAIWENGEIKPRSRKLNSKLHIKEGIIGHVVRTGESFITGDVRQVKFYKEWNRGTRSELTVPLKNAFGGIIGILNLESNNLNAFTESDRRLCENFAHAASTAIQQADLFEAVQSLQPLTETRSLKDLFDVVLRNLNKMMGANTASSVNLYDAKNDEFYAYYGVGPDQKFVNKYLLVPPRPDGTGRFVLKNRKPLYYDDVNNIPKGSPMIREESRPYRIASFAVLPLIYARELQGALFIHKIGELTHFTDSAKRILETYATQAALAIHTALHHIEIDPLKDILDATVSKNRKSILNLIVEKAVGLMNSDYSSLWLSEKGTGDLVRQAIYVSPGEEKDVDQKIKRISSDQSSINMNVFKTRETKLINDVRKAKDYNRIYRKAQSEIAVPLIYRDEALGTLNTESQRLGAYSDLDIRTLRVFADIAAIAIKIAQTREELIQSYHRLGRKNEGFEALTEISQKLAASIQENKQNIPSIIHEQASHIMDTDNMYVALYEPEHDRVHFELAYLDGRQVEINLEPGWEPRSGGKGRTEWIIRNKEPILTFNKADAESWYQQPDTKDYIEQKFASWLGVPILFGDEVLGVIATYHKTDEYKYGEDDLEILELMGKQAAIALINARLVRQLDKRVRELDVIRELGENLSQNAILA